MLTQGDLETLVARYKKEMRRHQDWAAASFVSITSPELTRT